MIPQTIIRKAFAALLMLVFLVAICPKQVLHDVFTNHSHNYVKMDGNKEVAINKIGLGCDCNTVHAVTPFLAEDQITSVAVSTVYPVYFCGEHTDFCSVYSLAPDSRGPPALG